MKKIIFPLVSALLIVVFANSVSAGEPTSPSKTQPIILKVTSHNPESASESVALKRFGERVNKLTNGQVSFRYFFGGTLAKAGEELEAIKSGVADMGILGFVYHPAEFALNGLFYAVPFGPTDPLLYNTIAQKIYATVPALTGEIKRYNQVMLFPIITDSYEINTKKPIRVLGDLNGLKLATIGIYHPKWVAAIGAVPITTPMAERFSGMQTGLIDGQVLSTNYISSLKFNELAPNIFMAGLGCTLWAAATMNQDAWNRLSPDIQKAFTVASKETSDWLGEFLKNNYTQQIADLKAKKVLISTLSDNDKKKWADALPDSPADWARSMEAKGLPGFEVWKQFKALAEQSGHRWPREFGLK